MVFDPFKNLGVPVSGIVVDDHMHRLLLGHLGINDVEEADELLMAMALHTLADDLAFQHIKRWVRQKFLNCKKSPNPDHVLMAVEDAVKVGEFELKGSAFGGLQCGPSRFVCTRLASCAKRRVRTNS